MLLFNFNNWQFWKSYQPELGTYGNHVVTFDGVNRLILVNEAYDNINMEEVYSNWKEWVLADENVNAQYLQALSVEGGYQLTSQVKSGAVYFLENGWRIRPYSKNHELKISGNLYTRELDENPLVPPVGDFSVTTSLIKSSNTEIVTVSGINDKQLDELHKLHGLQSDAPLQVTDTKRTAGNIQQDISGSDPVTVQRTDE
jgi:hypothetical protein